jgi:hypothetical protein
MQNQPKRRFFVRFFGPHFRWWPLESGYSHIALTRRAPFVIGGEPR